MPRLLALALLFPSSAGATHLLLVVLDDVGADKIAHFADYSTASPAPSFVPDTPALDTLAATGLAFTSAWAMPMCSPTRASLITGNFPDTTGVGYPLDALEAGMDESTVTLADVLGDAGYATGLFGKWHVGFGGSAGTLDWSTTLECASGSVAFAEDPSPVVHGFDVFRGNLGGEPESYTAWERVEGDGDGTATACLESGVHPDDYVVDEALAWIGAQTGDWFAMVSLAAPHADADGERQRWEVDDLSATCAALQGVAGSCVEAGHCGDADGDGVDDSYDLLYQYLTECADLSIEELLAGIPDTQLEDTLVVVLGDNGSPGNNGAGVEVMEDPYTRSFSAATGNSQYGKGTPFLSGVRVPLLIADGRNLVDARNGRTSRDNLIRSPGRDVSFPVVVVDLFDTTLATLGVTNPATTDGGSFAGCFSSTSTTCGSAGVGTRPIYAELFDHDETGALSVGRAQYRRASNRLVMDYRRNGTCVYPSLYSTADLFDETDLWASSTATTQRNVKREVTALNVSWLPLDSAGRIRWCR